MWLGFKGISRRSGQERALEGLFLAFQSPPAVSGAWHSATKHDTSMKRSATWTSSGRLTTRSAGW